MTGLNGYTTTRTAHLFTDIQFDFVLKCKPAIMMYAMAPPKGGTHTFHHDVVSRLEEFGYSADTALIDACMVGGHTSHLRWFAVAVLDGPNIKGLLTQNLPFWPLSAVPCLAGNTVGNSTKYDAGKALRPELRHDGNFTLSPSFGATVNIGASGVRPPRSASSCTSGISFPCHEEGPRSHHNGSDARAPERALRRHPPRFCERSLPPPHTRHPRLGGRQ